MELWIPHFASSCRDWLKVLGGPVTPKSRVLAIRTALHFKSLLKANRFLLFLWVVYLGMVCSCRDTVVAEILSQSLSFTPCGHVNDASSRCPSSTSTSASIVTTSSLITLSLSSAHASTTVPSRLNWFPSKETPHSVSDYTYGNKNNSRAPQEQTFACKQTLDTRRLSIWCYICHYFRPNLERKYHLLANVRNELGNFNTLSGVQSQ